MIAVRKKNVRLEMVPVGSITGRILDVDSRPVGHAAVLLRLHLSNNHGEYRLFSLAPGRYYVAVRLEDLTRRSVPLGFYPPGRILAPDRVESPVVTKRTLPTEKVVYFGDGGKKSIKLSVIPVRLP